MTADGADERLAELSDESVAEPLDEGVDLDRRIDELHDLLPAAELPAEERFWVLVELGTRVARRYELNGRQADRDEAIDVFRIAGDAPCPPDVEPGWIRLELARLLIDRGERDTNVGDIEAAIEYGRSGLAELTAADAAGLDAAATFHVLGVGHVLRAQYVPSGARADLDMAAAAFHEAIARLPGSHPAVGEVTGRAGVVLAMAAQHDVTAVKPFVPGAEDEWQALGERVTTALETLDTAWRAMPTADPYRTAVRYWLAAMRTTRFTCFGGDLDDCEKARTDLEAILRSPDCDDVTANVCHAFLALLHLYRSAPAAFRNTGRMPSQHQIARVMTTGNMIDSESARLALDHLEQVSASGSADPTLAAAMPLLRALATFGTHGLELPDESVAHVVAGFETASTGEPADDDLRRIRDIFRSIQSVRRGGPENFDTAIDTLDRIVEELDDEHPMRHLLQGAIGQVLDMAAAEFPNSRSASPEEREAALEYLEHVLAEVPDGHPDRAFTLTRLAATLGRSVEHKYSRDRLERVRGQLLDAIDRPAVDLENEAVNRALLAMIEGFRGLFGDNDARDLGDAIEGLNRAIAPLPPEHRLRRLGSGFLAGLLAQRYARGGDLEHLDAADYYARAVLEATEADDRPRGRSGTLMEWFRIILPLQRAQGGLDADRLDEAVRALRALAAGLPEDDSMRLRMESDADTMESLRSLFAPGTGDRHAASAAPVKEPRRDSPYYPVEMSGAGFGKVGHGFARRDLRMVDAGLAMMADACEAGEGVGPLRSSLVGALGVGLLMRYHLSRDRGDLSNAIDRLEEALGAYATDPFGNTVAVNLNALAAAYHLRGYASLGDRRRAAELGVACLRARAWGVMLQSSTERAFEAAVAAAGEAAEVALRAVADGFTDVAVEALERGRAMVLHTATADTGLPGLLRAAGHGELAAEWERALTEETGAAPWESPARRAGNAAIVEDLPEARLPGDLRKRVMTAIEGTEAERRLFTPATPAEIGAALREIDARALVYLVPHDEGRGGLVLAVAADGQVRRIPLPRLATGPRSRLEAFIRAQRDRAQADPETPEGRRIRRRWAYALGDLCDWAWTAAMEPVLEVVPDLAPDILVRPHRLIMVPVGELGAVPWHAARRAVAGGGRRYACQDAVISYAASARQFIDARRLGHRPWPSAAALVRVGGGGLYWASKEIEQIHRRHYQDGDLLGARRRRTDATRSVAATADNVRDLLPGPRSSGASLLHLGCHAYQAQRPVDSHLVLDRDEILGMTDILRRARARRPGAPGGLVVLAACGSDLTARDHDEALTLATAFLAAGAVGVVGTRWPVDDLPTALFMTMFHHYLNSGYDDPAVALRAAQLWMLNPRRSVPEDLLADLADLLDEAPVDEPESWAAFTYQGG